MDSKNEKGFRIKGSVEAIDYRNTKHFFKNRAGKYQVDNPYSVTMYQDNNPKLVEERNKREIEKLLPLLRLDSESKILDVACGIGRWSDALPEDICEYCGVDFSEELIQIAAERNTKDNRSFLVGSANEVGDVITKAGKGKFNKILLVGILMYLNETDVHTMLSQIEGVCEEHCIICVREPVGIVDRLTLKEFFSEELKDTYNAIYRTREELVAFFKETLLDKDFKIKEEGFLFEEDSLNNRKETAQYYYILER